MRHLQLLGVSADGAALELEWEGATYRLPVDEQLRAAMRRDPSRSRPDQAAPVTPRDMQARMRAGETAEDVADSAGIPVDRVRRYEGPVLAERAAKAAEARAAAVRRPGMEQPPKPKPLEALMAPSLADRGVAVADGEWDAWRREDGRWQVLFTFATTEGDGDGRALWVYDPARATVTPEDDEARQLVGLEPLRPTPRTAAPAPTEPAVLVPRLAPELQEEPELFELPELAAAAGDGRLPAGRSQGRRVEPADVSAAGGAGAAPGGPARPRGTKRASVPSWDDIVFGAAKRD
ncbi:MAG: DUF3071 domain-containing protein [Acidothermales bacterium]|nr:DUF3071 domain-containing protein [Acidothermales bacterium]